ncbi:hypothetical protein [Leptospira licerasiae]|uniref:hypothetical protein n=1 Tax=Leptospira licerasiae TaxID=447106 RepID=UPI0030162518
MDIVKWISEIDFSSTGKLILSSFFGASILAGALKLFMKDYIGSLFNFQLEEHKHKLNAVLEEIKFKFQSDLIQKRIALEKQNQVYVELYAKLLDCHSKICSLYEIQRKPTFEEYSKEDIDNYLRNKRVPLGKIEYILQLVDSNRKGAIEHMEKYLRMVEFQEARHSWENFSGQYWLNVLYLKKEIEDKFEKLRKDTHSLLVDCELLYNFPLSISTEELNKKKSDIDGALQSLVDSLKIEISIES